MSSRRQRRRRRGSVADDPDLRKPSEESHWVRRSILPLLEEVVAPILVQIIIYWLTRR